MDTLTTVNAQLPDTIEDLSRFVLVNEERVQALRAQIRAIKKVSLAKEVYEQKLAEAQEIGQITVEAAQKMGELLLTIQTQQGRRTDVQTSSSNIEEVKTKTEITSEMGMTKDQVSQYQQMAQNPEAVKAAVEKAIERGDVVSRSQVMKEIAEVKRQQRESEEQIDRLKRRLSETETENIRLRNQEPRVEVREVMPDDYSDMKRKYESSLISEKKMADQNLEMQKQLSEQRKRIADLEGRNGQAKLEIELELFSTHVVNFVKENAGYLYIFEHYNELSPKHQESFRNAVHTLDAMVKQMIGNLGGYGIE